MTEKKEYICTCGYKAKSAQGLTAHQRLTGHDKQNNDKGGCMHIYRKLTYEELARPLPTGETVSQAGFLLVCDKCKELF